MGGIFNCGIWNTFACSSRTTGAMDQRTPQLDSTHQKGPEIPIHRILMLVVGCCTGGEETLGGIFTYGIWNIFACSSRTTGAMDKRSGLLDSTHQIGLETPCVASLIVVR